MLLEKLPQSSAAELMQTKNNFLRGQCIAIFCKKQYSYNRRIYHTYLLLGTRGEGNNWHTKEREGRVAPTAKHARKRSEKPAHEFGFPCSRSAALDPKLLLLKRKMIFFYFISFHLFSQRKAANLLWVPVHASLYADATLPYDSSWPNWSFVAQIQIPVQKTTSFFLFITNKV